MDLVNQFIENCKRRRPSYETAGIIVARQLESALQMAGIRAIVTSRAKSPGCLKGEALRCNSIRTVPYKNMREICEGIADLADVRASLCFPGDRDKVNSLIASLLTILKTKQFLEQSRPPNYNKRLPGYWANHYRTQLKAESLDGTQKRYADTRIEIQTASVLMHTWSEVKRDLVYKPLQGTLPGKELAIVDELDDLVLAGEIVLEWLQSVDNERMKNKSTIFTSQYDLASYLYNYLSSNFRRGDVKSCMGNVELLFKLISRLKMDIAKEIESILKSARFEKDSRNISQQTIDQITTESEKRYQIYQELRINSNLESEACSQVTNNFFSRWVPLERYLNSLAFKNPSKTRGVFDISTLKRMNVLNKDCLSEIISLRKTRNVLTHNIELSEADIIGKQAAEARDLLIGLNIH